MSLMNKLTLILTLNECRPSIPHNDAQMLKA